MNYCICASGNLGYIALKQLIDSDINVKVVLTDKKSTSITVICDGHKIPCFKGNPRGGVFIDWFKTIQEQIDVLLSINYLFIIEKDILSLATKYCINFHGSLLPRYRGRTPHVWAIINDEKYTGITAHIMNEKCDDGDIVYQMKIKIQDDDTGGSILKKFNDYYPKIIMEVISKITSGKLRLKKQDNNLATYFGKRTPDDGYIDWNWQKRRIWNWIRAQAYPYPGAYTFYDNTKVIINKVSFCDHGFDYSIKNGTIIDFYRNKPIIKVPNGTLLIEEYICDKEITIGTCFY